MRAPALSHRSGPNAFNRPEPHERTNNVDATVGGKCPARIDGVDASRTQSEERKTAGPGESSPGRTS